MRKLRMKNSVSAVGVLLALLVTGCQSNAGNSSAETEALKAQIAQLEQQIADLEQRQGAGNGSVPSAPAADEVSDNDVQADAGSESSQKTQDGTSDAIGQSEAQTQNDASVGNRQSEAQTQNDTSVGNGQSEAQTQNDTGVGNGQSGAPQNDTGVGNSHVPGHDEGDYHDQVHNAGDSSAINRQGTSIDELTTYTLDELSTVVDAFVTKVCAAAPSGTAAQDMEQFFALKQEGKQIDDTLDTHEDELEYLYKTGSLTREEYKQQERKLELLEDQLDDIEDQLEYVFGIDD